MGPYKKWKLWGKNKIRTPTPGPLGAIFRFFWKILEGGQLEFRNFTRGLFSQKRRYWPPKKFGDPPLAPCGGIFIFFWTFQKLSFGSETLDITCEGLREMFEGDSADTCVGKFPLVSMGGRAEGLACADPGGRTPIGASGNFVLIFPISLNFF
jgi:hypothetical protein